MEGLTEPDVGRLERSRYRSGSYKTCQYRVRRSHFRRSSPARRRSLLLPRPHMGTIVPEVYRRHPTGEVSDPLSGKSAHSLVLEYRRSFDLLRGVEFLHPEIHAFDHIGFKLRARDGVKPIENQWAGSAMTENGILKLA
jgi:hypothetical protein